MAEPATINCNSACTVTVLHELALPPLQLDATGGAQIALAVLGVWAVGFGFRMLIRTTRVDENPISKDD